MAASPVAVIDRQDNDGGRPLDVTPDASGELPVREFAVCEDRRLPSQPLRRLSSRQYANTMRDLFGDELAGPILEGTLFPGTSIQEGFENDAEANLVNTAESNAIEDNAERIAGIIVADPETYVRGLMPCPLESGFSNADVDACVGQFIDEFGARAYRRPLADDEATIATQLYDTVRTEQSAVEAFAAVVQLFVQAPALLYRVERGAGEVGPGLARLSDHEMATRLSYFLTDSMPDDVLIAEAAAGRLSTPEDVEFQARRLMASDRFFGVLDGFHRDWLRLERLEQINKNEELYPAFSSEVRASLLEEASRFVRHVVEQQDGDVRTLLSGTTVPLNSVLAQFYGVEAPGAGPDTWVDVILSDRGGLLTLASVMASQADTDRTSPIHRGVFFQEDVLCNQLPAFPGNLDVQTPLQDTSTLPTARERLSPLMTNGSCSGCHRQFNPVGLAFENYDAAGQWRDQESGAEIDASGSITLDDMQYDFSTPQELVDLIAGSQQAQDCYTLQWFRNAMGRREFAQDACSLAHAERLVDERGGDIRELLLALTQTDAFLYRRAEDLSL